MSEPSPRDPDEIERQFRARPFIEASDWGASPSEALRRFAAKAKPARPHGEIAASVLDAYRSAADGTKRGEALGIAAVLAWMRLAARRTKKPLTAGDAVELYADALLARDAWVTHCNRPARAAPVERPFHEERWAAVLDVAKVTGIHERTLRRMCAAEEIPAAQRAKPKATWWINLTACIRESAGNETAKFVSDRYRFGKGRSATATAAARRTVDVDGEGDAAGA